MFMPESHVGGMKKSRITFYNEETENLMESFEDNPFETSRNTVAHVFKETSKKTGINLSAQTLRSVFAQSMSIRQIPDRYIGAFCVRVPANVLGKHYSDYSPEVLKKIDETADIMLFI